MIFLLVILSISRPCYGFHSQEENVKIFETIKIILKSVIHEFQHERARIELKSSIFRWKQQISEEITRACAREKIVLSTVGTKDGILLIFSNVEHLPIERVARGSDAD